MNQLTFPLPAVFGPPKAYPRARRWPRSYTLNGTEFLDPWQLLKHALGLATSSGPDFSLWYLYYDCLGQRSDAHKKEIQTFANRVEEEIRFKALTYQEGHGRLKESYQSHFGYLDYLYAGYFS